MATLTLSQQPTPTANEPVWSALMVSARSCPYQVPTKSENGCVAPAALEVTVRVTPGRAAMTSSGTPLARRFSTAVPQSDPAPKSTNRPVEVCRIRSTPSAISLFCVNVLLEMSHWLPCRQRTVAKASPDGCNAAFRAAAEGQDIAADVGELALTVRVAVAGPEDDGAAVRRAALVTVTVAT